MSARSTRKGKRTELELAHALNGRRQPLSGALGGAFTGDVVAVLAGREMRFESKARANGFKSLYEWLERVDGLCLRADRQPWLIVLPLETLCELVGQPVETRPAPPRQPDPRQRSLPLE